MAVASVANKSAKSLILFGGGEGGIRTPDTVARMPHFECGAFDHSATSPNSEGLSVAAPYLAVTGARHKGVTARRAIKAPARACGRANMGRRRAARWRS